MDFNSPQIVTAFFTLGGVLIGSVSTLVLTFINRRFDDRRHLRQLSIEAAIAYWKEDRRICEKEATAGNRARLSPLDPYIVHMLQLAELVSTKRLTADNAELELRNIISVSDAAYRAGEDKPHDA